MSRLISALAKRPTTSLAAAALAVPLMVAVPPALAHAAQTSTAQTSFTQTSFTTWTTNAQFATGKASTAAISGGSLVMKPGTTSGVWQSPWVTGSARYAVPSWNVASAPAGSSVNVWVRVRQGSKLSGWKFMATWRHDTTKGPRTSYGSQSDALASVATDQVEARPGVTWTGWQMKVELRRAKASAAGPRISALHLAASNLGKRTIAKSKTTMTRTIDLKVPRFSQMVHRGHFREWGGGGNVWCSPTTTTMLLKYLGKGVYRRPAQRVMGTNERDAVVDYAAKSTWDSGYRGAGNWSFNMAFASRYGTTASVRRLADLRDVEALVKKGIPVGASIAFGKGKLSRAPISSTPGHLVVIRGFTKKGHVIVNDPAAASNASVRRVYWRAQFERAWLGGSGGVVYVVTAN